MTEGKKAYQHAFKATSLFGGVQVFHILMGLIKNKVIAVLLGKNGMGIFRLLITTVDVTTRISNFGLPQSAVKFIANNLTRGNREKAFKFIAVLNKMLWVTGIFGTVLLIILSPFLSRLLFASDTYVFPIIWLSVTILFNQLAKGKISILQSLQKLKQLAKANLWGSFVALLIVIPLFYIFEKEAIVPSIIISAIINYFFSWLYLKKNKIPKIKLARAENYAHGKPLFKLGMALSFSSLLSILTAYILQIFVDKLGGLEQVGLFSAGFLIINRYGNLIFSAMEKDYYPRLAGVADDNSKVRHTVEHQALIAILLMTPIIVLFIALSPQLIQLLFSRDFLAIKLMVVWGMLGLWFKALAWPMAYVLIAKGDSKIYVSYNVGFSIIELGMNMLGYYYAGLTGLGFSFMAYQFIHLLAVYIIDHFRYDFYLPQNFYRLVLICLLFCTTCLLLTFLSQALWNIILLGIIVVLSGVFAYVQLNKKIDFKEMVKNFLGKRK